MAEADSPYAGVPEADWLATTERLISEHPLATDEIVAVVLASWESLFQSKLGVHGFSIGTEIFPSPQIMAFIMHELIPLEFESLHPGEWRRDQTGREKDLVYLPDLDKSVEIKLSSNASQFFGNRSYAQPSTTAKKSKSGYYLAINFEKFGASSRPNVRIIRFGWLEHTDWIAQASATGQQARVSASAYAGKLIELYRT